jgi:hypothetical protein
MYETRKQAPISRPLFARRVALHFAFAMAMIFGSLALGMVGYMYFESLAWRDAFVNAAMLLGGMGPVDMPKTNGGKIFSGLYALYCGLLIILATGVILSPLLHRIMHKFHWAQVR